MARAAKVVRFLSDARFRRSKMRQWVLPLFRAIYPDIEVIGLRDNDGNIILLHTEDRFITLDYIKFGNNVTARSKLAFDILERHGRRSGGLFLDVGANIGTETLTALSSGAFSRSLAIEPERSNIRLAQANAVMQGLEDRVKFVRAAISNEPGMGSIVLSKRNRGDHRIVPGACDADPVPLQTLDALISAEGIAPQDVSLVWVDVQGFEGFVLGGASTLIESGTPFVLEWWPRAMRDAGSYDLALEVVRSKFRSFFDLSETAPQAQDVATIGALEPRFVAADEYTDILLF